jgi:hypothetical protein
MHPRRLRVLAIASLTIASMAFGMARVTQAAEGERGREQRAASPASRPGAAQPSQPRANRPSAPAQRAWRDAQGRHFDDRHGHDRFYPPRGSVVPVLPDGYRHYRHDGRNYFSYGGIWYEPRGPRFVVVRPPLGLYVSVLPPFYTTLWFGGVPYYYADDVYYLWRPQSHGYEVVDPPGEEDRAPPATGGDDLFIYPKNGQSADQQAADRYECHSWARNQTGFDPTADRGGVPAGETGARRADYLRAMTACLEARGYSVR